jgi:hypothetical protein
LSRILQILFYAVFTGLSDYFNAERLKIWMFFLKRILDLSVAEQYRQTPTKWNDVLQAEHHYCWKVKVKALKIVNKILFHVRMVGKQQIETPGRLQFLQNLQSEFYNSYLQGFFETSMMLCKMSQNMLIVPNLVDQAMRNMFSCLQEPKVVLALGWQKLWTIVTDICLPALSPNLKDQEMWCHDPSGYIGTRDSRVDLHNLVKFGAKDLFLYLMGLTPKELGFNTTNDLNLLSCLFVHYISEYSHQGTAVTLTPDFDPREVFNMTDGCIRGFMKSSDLDGGSIIVSEEALIEALLFFGDKADISHPYVLHNYHRSVLSVVLTNICYKNIGTHQRATSRFELVRLIDRCSSILIDNLIEYQGEDIAGLLETFSIDSNIVSRFNQKGFIQILGKFLETNIMSEYLPLQTISLVTMTRYISLCSSVKEEFRSAVSPLLKIAVPLLHKIDHKNVIEAINILVKEYPEEIIPYSFELLGHIAHSFQSYLIHSKNRPHDSHSTCDDSTVSEDSVSEDYFEAFRAAAACIDTVHRLLFLKQKPLFQPGVHEQSEQIILEMFMNALQQEDKDMFHSCLLVLPALFQKANAQEPRMISSALKYFFPIICYILCELGPAGLLKHSDIHVLPALSEAVHHLPQKFKEALIDVNYAALSESAVSAAYIALNMYASILGIEGLANEREFYIYRGSDQPRTFLQLLYDTTKHVVSTSLTGTTDLDIVMMLRVFTQVINTLHESGRVPGTGNPPAADSMIPLVIDMIDFGLNLAKEGGNRNRLLQAEILSLISTCVWVRPLASLEYLSSQNNIQAFLQAVGSLPSAEQSQLLSILAGLSSWLSARLQVEQQQGSSVAGLVEQQLLKTSIDMSIVLTTKCVETRQRLLRANNLLTTNHRSQHANLSNTLNHELRVDLTTHDPDISSLDSSRSDCDPDDDEPDDEHDERSEVVPALEEDIPEAQVHGIGDGIYEMLGKEIRSMDRSLEKKKRLIGIEYFTPKERTCPLTILKLLLEGLERQNPELAKDLVEKVGIVKVNEFLKAVQISHDYFSYLDNQRSNYL